LECHGDAGFERCGDGERDEHECFLLDCRLGDDDREVHLDLGRDFDLGDDGREGIGLVYPSSGGRIILFECKAVDELITAHGRSVLSDAGVDLWLSCCSDEVLFTAANISFECFELLDFLREEVMFGGDVLSSSIVLPRRDERWLSLKCFELLDFLRDK